MTGTITIAHARNLKPGDVVRVLGAERTVDDVRVDRDVVLVFYTDGRTDTFPPSRVVWRVAP